jgi:hypothetical protein
MKRSILIFLALLAIFACVVPVKTKARPFWHRPRSFLVDTNQFTTNGPLALLGSFTNQFVASNSGTGTDITLAGTTTILGSEIFTNTVGNTIAHYGGSSATFSDAYYFDGESEFNVRIEHGYYAIRSNSIPYMRLENGAAAFAVDVVISTAGKGLQIKEGSNSKMGTATMVNGTVTVSTTAVTASSRVFLTRQSFLGSTAGSLSVGTVTAGTSFVIKSYDDSGVQSADDDSVVAWMLIEPAP